MKAKKGEKEERPAAGKLSSADRLILDSYKTTMEGLAVYFGEAFEFVLHDITDYDHSIIKIINGNLSGRKAGSPITDFAISMLNQLGKNKKSQPYISYLSKSKYGKPIRSTTIVIFGAGQKPIGLLCINLYLDSPISSILQNFSLVSQPDHIAESYSSDSNELIHRALEKIKADVMTDISIPQHMKNKEIVTLLYHQGIFKFKDAVQDISKDLGISKNTVYFHIRSLEEKQE